MLLKRVATLETLRKERPRRSRHTLHAPSLTRLPAPHPIPPRTLFRIRATFLTALLRRKVTPLRTAASHNNPPPPQGHSPPDRCILLPRSYSRNLIHLLTKPILAVCRTLLFSEPSTCSLSSKCSSLPSTALSLSSLSRFSRSFSLSSFSHARLPLARVLSLSLSFSSQRRVLPLHLPCHVSRGVPNATAAPLPQAITPHLTRCAHAAHLHAPSRCS